MFRPPPTSTLFPYTTLFRSTGHEELFDAAEDHRSDEHEVVASAEQATTKVNRLLEYLDPRERQIIQQPVHFRSEEHTSELQSRFDLVCRLLLEKKKQ